MAIMIIDFLRRREARNVLKTEICPPFFAELVSIADQSLTAIALQSHEGHTDELLKNYPEEMALVIPER
jgi:hypothetical protein